MVQFRFNSNMSTEFSIDESIIFLDRYTKLITCSIKISSGSVMPRTFVFTGRHRIVICHCYRILFLWLLSFVDIILLFIN